MLDIMYDVSISTRLTTTTTTTKEGWWSVGDHVRCIHLSTVNYNYNYDKEGWWSIGDNVRCIHLSTVNYNYDEGGMMECWISCTMYPSQLG